MALIAPSRLTGETYEIYCHELAHALAVSPYPALITRGDGCLITAPFCDIGEPGPTPTELLGCILAGPAFDFLVSGGSDMDLFLAAMFEEAATCQPHEDCAKAVALMDQLPPGQIADAIRQAERAAKAALAIFRTNQTGIAVLADAIERCSSALGILVTESELVDLMQGRSPFWYQILDFD